MSAPTIIVTYFNHASARSKVQKEISKHELAEQIWLERAPSKDQLPWLKLASFGELKTAKGSLRHDRNMLAVYGIEADYDGEKISFDDAAATLENAGIDALLYTSPSHQVDKPRWRVLCFFSTRYDPKERNRFVARLNGVFAGALTAESFTASQSYYFGAVGDGKQHRVQRIDGEFIDLMDGLDATARGKAGRQKHSERAAGSKAGGDYVGLDELIERIISGESLHPSVTAIAGKFARDGIARAHCVAIVGGAFNAAQQDRYGPRWQECVEAINDIYNKEESKQKTERPAVMFADFLYYSPENKFIFQPDGTRWPAAAVNARLPWIGGVKPSTIIARDKPVEQMTWAPGKPRLIKHELVSQGGWIERPNATVFNHYRAPHVQLGHAHDAAAWVEHVHYVYPDEAGHIIQWLAHRCQHPQTKINHALVLGGAQGIGKDTLLAPVLHAIGFWNHESVSPTQLLGRFNSHLKSVILIISEARDLGDVNRPQFYEHLKAIIAAPPNVLLVDEKNTHPYYIPNIVGVVITTNHKAGGIYLSPEDRRHFVAWSPLEMANIGADYFDRMWGFYANGGFNDVASYLRDLDIRGFDPKAPPPKTQAFWEIVTTSQNPEVVDIEDAITSIGSPDFFTLGDLFSLTSVADADALAWLKDRKNRRMLPRWFEQAGYVTVRNPDARNGIWRIGGKKHMVWGKKTIPTKDLLAAIMRRAGAE